VTGNLTANDIPDIRTIVFISGNPSRIAVGGLYGVFQMATNAAGTWQRLGSGLPNAVVYDLAYDLVDDTLVAAEMGRGVWKLTSVGGTPPPVASPTGVTATALSGTLVQVTWTASAGASGYDVYRSTSINGSWSPVCSVACTSGFLDDTVASGTTYLYKVRAVSLGFESPDSNVDFATAVGFTDDYQLSGKVISHTYLQQIRDAVNALRLTSGLTPLTFSNPASAGSPILATDITALRTGITDAFNALRAFYTSAGFTSPNPTFGEAIVAHTTPIRASHWQEIREACK
jgi:hypothetical protein